MAAALLVALLLDLALAIRLEDTFQPSLERAHAAVLSEGDVILRREGTALNVSRPVVDIFFAFDSSLGMVKRRVMIRSSMEKLRQDFMDGEEGREKIAWRFFSDDELPDTADVHFAQQPPEIRKPWGKKPLYMMLRRWLHDLSWSRRHYDFRWMVRADDDGVLCPRNFARFTEGLRTLQPAPRKSLRAKQRAVKPWLDSWTEEQLLGMHEDYPKAMLALSVPCSTSTTKRMTQFRCKVSAEEQYKRQVRMFEAKTITGDPDTDFTFRQMFEENFIVVTPEFIDDLMEKVDSDPDCQPKADEYIDHYLMRLIEESCSEKKWPPELTIVNMGRWDAGVPAGGGMSSWGHSVWDSNANRMTLKFHTLKQYQAACEDHDMIWFHHVTAKMLSDVTVPESLEWLDKLPETYDGSKPAPGDKPIPWKK